MNLQQSQLENAKSRLMSRCGQQIRRNTVSVQPVLLDICHLWDDLVILFESIDNQVTQAAREA